MQRKIAGNLEQTIPKEQDSSSGAELRGAQSNRMVHPQGSEADVVPIHIVQQVTDAEKGKQSPEDFREGAPLKL